MSRTSVREFGALAQLQTILLHDLPPFCPYVVGPPIPLYMAAHHFQEETQVSISSDHNAAAVQIVVPSLATGTAELPEARAQDGLGQLVPDEEYRVSGRVDYPYGMYVRINMIPHRDVSWMFDSEKTYIVTTSQCR